MVGKLVCSLSTERPVVTEVRDKVTGLCRQDQTCVCFGRRSLGLGSSHRLGAVSSVSPGAALPGQHLLPPEVSRPPHTPVHPASLLPRCLCSPGSWSQGHFSLLLDLQSSISMLSLRDGLWSLA